MLLSQLKKVLHVRKEAMDFMKKFFNRKRIIFSIVIVAVVAILIGTLAVKPRVERWMVEN